MNNVVLSIDQVLSVKGIVHMMMNIIVIHDIRILY